MNIVPGAQGNPDDDVIISSDHIKTEPLEITDNLQVEEEHLKKEHRVARNAAPSGNQLETLVGFLEARPWLAKGHARTANARTRSRDAWAEIATTINSYENGCVKSPGQWCKYWKDKKGAMKRKFSQINALKRHTGGGEEDIPEFSEIEFRILNVLGGESFATGDGHLEITPFLEQATDRNEAIEESPSIFPNPTSNTPSLDNYILKLEHASNPVSNVAVIGESSTEGNAAHSIHTVIAGTERSTPEQDVNLVLNANQQGPDLQQHLSPHRGNQIQTQRVQREVPHGHRHTFLSPRGSAARRRLLRRSPPSQRRSKMVSLTEKLIAMEERRIEAELNISRAMGLLAESKMIMARAVDRGLSILEAYLKN